MTGTIVRGLPDDAYHQQPSLSASGAKILLQEGGPAKYRQYRDHVQAQRDELDWGTALHTELLGTGTNYADVGYRAWNAAGCKAAKQRILDAGLIPLRSHDYAAVKAAAEAARKHPVVARILAEGEPEVSLSWRDDEHGVELRCRPDWYRRGLCADVKSCADASPTGFGKAIVNLSYDLAGAFYLDGIDTVLDDPDCAWCWICVEKSEPYLTAVYAMPARLYERGHERYREAVRIFAHCTETGRWDGYPTEVIEPVVPSWA